MTTLSSQKVILGETLTISRPQGVAEPCVKVPAVGDNNCGFNAFALGLIDLIHRGQLTELNADISGKFIAAICNEENLAILRSRDYEDLTPLLQRFINFAKNDLKKMDDLFTYVKKQTTRFEIAALHLALAPALRQLTPVAFDAVLAARRIQGLPKETKLEDDGTWVGVEELMSLAEAFGLKLTTLSVGVDNQGKRLVVPEDGTSVVQDGGSSNANAPHFMLVLEDIRHWDYLFPATQKNGLATLLQTNSEEVILDYAKTHLKPLLSVDKDNLEDSLSRVLNSNDKNASRDLQLKFDALLAEKLQLFYNTENPENKNEETAFLAIARKETLAQLLREFGLFTTPESTEVSPGQNDSNKLQP